MKYIFNFGKSTLPYILIKLFAIASVLCYVSAIAFDAHAPHQNELLLAEIDLEAKIAKPTPMEFAQVNTEFLGIGGGDADEAGDEAGEDSVEVGTAEESDIDS